MSEALGSRTTTGKALQINLDLEKYGAFAEIGAGQEVARFFFQAGRASQTIAKTISAYDMIYSDEIYGKEKNGRYVCESRLNKMLEKESALLIKRLDTHRGDKTTFFAYANTVATGSAETPRTHGWMGVRFQKKPKGPFNDIILHVRMQDKHRLHQQEALGVLGVNLIYSAFYSTEKKTATSESFLNQLIDGLKKSQIVIDVIKVVGPDLEHFDNRKLNLELVKMGLAETVLFSPNQEVLNISDTVWNKGLLIQRGFYRPITNTHVDVLNKGLEQLKTEMKLLKLKSTDIIPILEITSEFGIQIDDFINRIEIISSMGFHLMVSNFKYFYELKNFFRRFTSAPLVIVLSARHLQELFEKSHYKNLEGGIFEALGKLLDDQSKLYIYPHKTDLMCLTTKSFFPPKDVIQLYRHFVENMQIVDISGCDNTDNYYHSSDVKKMIESKNKQWEKLVPENVKVYIKKHKIWNAE